MRTIERERRAFVRFPRPDERSPAERCLVLFFDEMVRAGDRGRAMSLRSQGPVSPNQLSQMV